MAEKVNLLTVGQPTRPATGNFVPQRGTLPGHIHSIMRAQDRVLSPGRRVLLSYGLGGSARYSIGNSGGSGSWTGNNSGGDYDNLLVYVVDDAQSMTVQVAQNVPVTPGHVLWLRVLHQRSGLTIDEYLNPGDENAPYPYFTGSYGAVELTAVWDDGTTTDTVVTTLQLTESPGEYAFEPGSALGAFGEMRVAMGVNAPESFMFNETDQAQWCKDGVTVDLTLKLLGATRVVDCTVFERPHVLAQETTDDPRPGHVYTAQGYPYPHAVEGLSSGDQRYGCQRMLDVAREQADQLGPVIFNWTCATESPGYQGGTPSLWTHTGSGGAYVHLGTDLTTSESTPPEWDFSAGCYGRTIDLAEQGTVFDSSGGPVAVKFSIYWLTSGGTATVRYRTADYSYVETTTTSTSLGWTECVGWLDAGASVKDDRKLQITLDVTSGETVSVYAVRAEYLRG